MAKGETRPSRVTGMEKRSIVPRSELKKMPTETCASPVIDQVRILWLTKGRMEVERAAIAVIVQSICSDGWRSARRPPIK